MSRVPWWSIRPSWMWPGWSCWNLSPWNARSSFSPSPRTWCSRRRRLFCRANRSGKPECWGCGCSNDIQRMPRHLSTHKHSACWFDLYRTAWKRPGEQFYVNETVIKLELSSITFHLAMSFSKTLNSSRPNLPEWSVSSIATIDRQMSFENPWDSVTVEEKAERKQS